MLLCARCFQQRGLAPAVPLYSPALLLYSRALLLFQRCCSCVLVSAAPHIPSVAVFALLFSSLFCFGDPPLSSCAASGDGNTWHFSFFIFFSGCFYIPAYCALKWRSGGRVCLRVCACVAGGCLGAGAVGVCSGRPKKKSLIEKM